MLQKIVGSVPFVKLPCIPRPYDILFLGEAARASKMQQPFDDEKSSIIVTFWGTKPPMALLTLIVELWLKDCAMVYPRMNKNA